MNPCQMLKMIILLRLRTALPPLEVDSSLSGSFSEPEQKTHIILNKYNFCKTSQNLPDGIKKLEDLSLVSYTGSMVMVQWIAANNGPIVTRAAATIEQVYQ